jgi:SseB protein N-terminal domain
MNSFENTPTPDLSLNGAHALPPSNGALPVETALAAGMAAGDTDAVMRAVASIEVMVPQTVQSSESGAPGEPGDLPAGSLSLPVIEQEGTSYVPVFTSEATMNLAAPDIDDAVSVPAAALGANWPSDELWLAVNPGTEGGLTLPPDAVRSLPSYANGAS